jgi:hypothetical protein
MNKFTELRRQLILRLIVFEHDLFGYLDILEALFVSKLTTAQTAGLLSTLDTDTLKAVAKASLYFSYYCSG